MEMLLEVALSNALAATVMAFVVFGISKFCKRPAILHFLWLIVLLKFVTPPLISVPVPFVHVSTSSFSASPTTQQVSAEQSVDESLKVKSESADVDALATSEMAVTRAETIGSAHSTDAEPLLLPPDSELPSDTIVVTAGGELRVIQSPPVLAARTGDLPESSVVHRSASADDVSDQTGRVAQENADFVSVTRPSQSASIVRARHWDYRTWMHWLSVLWCFGIVVATIHSGWRMLSFRRRLLVPECASGKWQREMQSLATRIGLSRVPRLYITDDRVSPMVWGCLAPCVIVPRRLFERLDRSCREMILLHELVHLRRGDQWARLLELVVGCVFWWYPVIRWICRHFRVAEEQCCDGWVLKAMPFGARTYAGAIMDTLDFLADDRSQLPAVASGIGQFGQLKTRLTMILSSSPPTSLSRGARYLLVTVALCVLPATPMLSGDDVNADSVADAPATEDDAVETAAQVTPDSREKRYIGFGEPTQFETTPLAINSDSVEVWGLSFSPDGSRLLVARGRWDQPGQVQLWDLNHRTVKTVDRFAEGIASATFSTDGKRFAAVGWSSILKIYDSESLQVLTEIPIDNSVARVAFSPDGAILATCTEGHTQDDDNPAGRKVQLWDATTGKELATLPGEPTRFHCIAFSKNGQWLAAGGGRWDTNPNGKVYLYDVKSKKLVHTLEGHTGPVLGLAFSPDGKTLATGSLDRSIRLWDVADGKEEKTLSGHTNWVESLAFSRDGKVLVSSSHDQSVVLWNVFSGEVVHRLAGHSDAVRAVAISPDGRGLVTGGADNSIRLWDITTGQSRGLLRDASEMIPPSPILAVACAPNDRLIATAHEDMTVQLRDRETGKTVNVLKGHTDIVSALAFSGDGRWLASAGYDRVIHLWDLQKGEIARTLSGHSNWVFAVAFSPDGKRLASGGYDKSVFLWETAGGGKLAQFDGHTAAVRSVAFSPDGNTLASGSGDRTVRLWDIANRKETATLKGHTSSIRAVAFAPDGSTLASASEDHSIKLWNVGEAKEIRTLTGHTGMVWCLAFSPAGRTLASGSFDNTVRLWDPATGQLRQTISGHTDVVTSVTFTPDVSALVSGSFDQTIKIWPAQLPPLEPAFELRTHGNGPRFARFTSDGRLFITGGDDGLIHLRDMSTGAIVDTFKGNNAGVACGDVSPDDSTLVTGGWDNTIRIWDLKSRKLLKTLTPSKEQIDSVCFSSDGKRLVSGGCDGIVRLWDTSSWKVLAESKPQSLPITCVDFSPNDRLIACSIGDWKRWQEGGGVKLWDGTTLSEVADLGKSPVEVKAVRFSPDGKILAATAVGGQTEFWDVGSRSRRGVIRMPEVTKCFAFLSDGMVAVADHGGNISIWDIATQQKWGQFGGHEKSVYDLTTSPDGTLVVSCADDGMVKFWPLLRGSEQQRLRADGPWVMGVKFSHDGKWAFTTRGPGNSFVQWNTANWQSERQFSGHSSTVTSLAISKDERVALAGCSDGTAQLWDLRNGNRITRFSKHDKAIRSVAITPDKRFAITGGLGKRVKVWDIITGELRHEREGRASPYEIDLLPDGRTLVICDHHAAALWNVESGKEIKRLEGHIDQVIAVDASPNGKQLLTGTRRGVLRLFDVDSGKLIKVYRGHTDQLRCVAFSPDGKTALTGGYDTSIIHWDLKSGEVLARHRGHGGYVLDVAFSPDGKTAISGGADQSARVWRLATSSDQLPDADRIRSWNPADLQSVADLKPQYSIDAHQGGAWFVSYSPKGKLLASGGADKTVKVWNASTGQPVMTLQGHTNTVTCGIFSPDGKTLATGGTDNTIRLWNVADGSVVAVLSGHTGSLRQLAFSPNGLQLASGGEDSTTRVWDVPNKTPLWVGKESLPVYNIKFTVDGSEVVIGTGNWRTREMGQLTIRSASDGRTLRTIDDTKNLLMGIAVSPNGNWVATRNTAGAIGLWDIRSGQPIRTMGRTAGYRTLDFSPDGKHLAGGGSTSGVLTVWNVATGKITAECVGHQKLVFCVDMSPDGKSLASASEDGTIKVWVLEPIPSDVAESDTDSKSDSTDGEEIP